MSTATVYPTHDQYGNFINVPTWYAHFGRQWQLALDNQRIYRRYVDDSYVGDDKAFIPTYIDDLNKALEYHKAENNTNEIEELTAKIENAETNYPIYTAKYESGLANEPFFDAILVELEQNNDVYKTVKYDEAQYIVDVESAALYNYRQDPSVNSTVGFLRNKEVNMTTENAVDATRIWSNGSGIINCTINDLREYNEAHRDGIQLIPPPQQDDTREGTDGGPWRMGDQTVGASLFDARVEGNKINAPLATMQGVFGSDGFFGNMSFRNNSIITQGYHFITLNGFMSGNISGNVLESTGVYPPKIYMNSGRVGGNIADDGMVSILSFNDSKYSYDKPVVDSPNTAIMDGVRTEVEIQDNRGIIPCEFKKLAVGMDNFRFTEYYDYYNNLTVGEYKVRHPKEYQNMQTWLLQRIDEYDPADPRVGLMPYMPDASNEQIYSIRPILQFAYDNLMDGSIDHYRIPELLETAIRSFVTKQIALMFGDIQPLSDIGEIFNIRRQNYLKFLLDDSYFDVNNMIVNVSACPGEKGYDIDTEDSRNIDFIDIETNAPRVGIQYKLTNKDTGSVTYGYTNSSGTVDFTAMQQADYTLDIIDMKAIYLEED